MSETALRGGAQTRWIERTRVWGLHCDEDVDLVEGEIAAMGWDRLGDLNDLEPTREGFKEAIREAYPSARPGTISQWAGQLYRFVYDAREDELVVYRERGGGPINVGLIRGPYTYVRNERYGQRRPVQWVDVGLVPGDFPPGALYELGASLTWFRIRRHADIWISVVQAITA